MRAVLKKFASQFRLGLIHLLAAGIALGEIEFFSLHKATNAFASGSPLLAGKVASVVCAAAWVHLALAIGGVTRRWRVIAALFPTLVTLLLLGYHVRARAYFDPAVMLDQADVGLGWEVIHVILGGVHWGVVLAGLLLFVALLLIDIRWKIGFPESSVPRWKGSAVATVVWLVAFCTPVGPYDELSAQVAMLVSQSRTSDLAVNLGRGEYPLIHANPSARRLGQAAHPVDVFVVFVESFNVNFVNARASNGKEYTPFFNSLIPQGVYVEKFYGNSIQTAKGHFASLCSVIPTMRGREYVKYFEDRFQCLPTILDENGYDTVFFQASAKINYDNAARFLKRNGFAYVETVARHRKPGDDEFTWGWGLQDDKFYERFFDYFAERLAKKSNGGPLMVALAPISNHMRFNQVPPQERHIFAHPTKPEEFYANTVNVADRGLEVLFRRLRHHPRFQSAMVIITGDHSFPVGEHGLYHNETGAYEEFFRVPFLMVAKDLKPERISDVAFSQLDMAPTILDYLKVEPERSHFMGRSILTQPRIQAPVYLVQPYGGVYLGVVESSLKFTLNLRTGHAALFDLAVDPQESKNLAELPEKASVARHLRGLLRAHFQVDAAYRTNQIWQ